MFANQARRSKNNNFYKIMKKKQYETVIDYKDEKS